MGTSVVAFLIVLGVLIFVHEFGHFVVARLFGVGVETFSLGFGPRIFGVIRGRTDYRVSALPLGGYVKMVGESPESEVEPEDLSVSFTHKHVLKRLLIVTAGPAFNLLLAVVIFFGIYAINGFYVREPNIGKVEANSPAQHAGLRTGDRVTAINGQPVKGWDDLATLVSHSQGRPLTMTVRRADGAVSLSITPTVQKSTNIFGEAIERYMIGVAWSGDVRAVHIGPIQAMGKSLFQVYDVSRLTVQSIVLLIEGRISAKNLSGPIAIAQMAGQQAREGMVNLLFFIAWISINLGILNVLPIPVLDGGHMLFFGIEAVRGKPVSIRVREIAQQAGILLLLMLMIFVIYNDVSRIFF